MLCSGVVLLARLECATEQKHIARKGMSILGKIFFTAKALLEDLVECAIVCTVLGQIKREY